MCKTQKKHKQKNSTNSTYKKLLYSNRYLAFLSETPKEPPLYFYESENVFRKNVKNLVLK